MLSSFALTASALDASCIVSPIDVPDELLDLIILLGLSHQHVYGRSQTSPSLAFSGPPDGMRDFLLRRMARVVVCHVVLTWSVLDREAQAQRYSFDPGRRFGSSVRKNQLDGNVVGDLHELFTH